VNMDKFYEKKELLRIIFMPINNRLKSELGSSLVEVKEGEWLYVTFITSDGTIRIKCSSKRFMITEFSVKINSMTIDFILLRFALFLRRNEIQIISILNCKETEILQSFLEDSYHDSTFESYGDHSYVELKVGDYIDKFYKKYKNGSF